MRWLKRDAHPSAPAPQGLSLFCDSHVLVFNRRQLFDAFLFYAAGRRLRSCNTRKVQSAFLDKGVCMGDLAPVTSGEWTQGAARCQPGSPSEEGRVRCFVFCPVVPHASMVDSAVLCLSQGRSGGGAQRAARVGDEIAHIFVEQDRARGSLSFSLCLFV